MIVSTAPHPSSESGNLNLGEIFENSTEWNASRKLNCRQWSRRRRRQWGFFSVPQGNKRSPEDICKSAYTHWQSCFLLVQEVLSSTAAWAPFHSRAALSLFLSQLPANDGRRVECSPSCHHAAYVYSCLQLQATAGWLGEGSFSQPKTSDSHSFRAERKNVMLFYCFISWGQRFGSRLASNCVIRLWTADVGKRVWH